MSEYQIIAKNCKCCTKHVPLPTTLKMYNDVVVCPTTYSNIMEYKRIWNSIGSRPPGKIRKHFSEYVQLLVEQSIDKNDESVIQSN